VATAEQMQVKVRDGFPAVGSVVDDQAIAGLVEFQLPGHFLGGGEKVAEDGVMFRGNGGVAGVMLFGDQEDVDRGLGGDIAKGKNVLVLKDNVGWNFTFDDPFEDRFGHTPSFLPDGQFEQLGAEMAGASPDEVDDFVVEPLTGAPPRAGAGEGENTGAEAFQAKDGGKGGDFFVHHGGQALEKNHLHGAVFGQSSEIDGRGGGAEFEMAGDSRATDAGEGAAQDHFKGVALDDGADEIVPKIMENGPGDFLGQGPLLVAGAGGGLFQGKNQPRLVQAGGLDSGGGDQRQRPREGFFSGHRGF
jgi:hypothetical protein